MHDPVSKHERNDQIIHCLKVIEDCQHDMAFWIKWLRTYGVLVVLAAVVCVFSFSSGFTPVDISLSVITVLSASFTIVFVVRRVVDLRADRDAHAERLVQLQETS